MSSKLDEMKRCIKRAFPGYMVSVAFEAQTADRPVLKKAVYIMPAEIREKETDFIIYVYSPVSLGGQECVKTACEVYNALFNGGIEIENISVGAVYYDSNSQGFAVKITGKAADDSLVFKKVDPESDRIDCTLTHKLASGIFSSKFKADSGRVICTSENYPIMTIYESRALDVIEGVKSYKIVIEGVAFDDVNVIAGLRMFDISMSNDYLKYCDCQFEKYEKDSQGKYTVTIFSNSVL